MFKKLKPLSDKILRRAKEDAMPTGEWAVKVSMNDVETFGARNGKRAVREAIGKLGKYQPYYNILTSEIGQHLLGDAIEQCNLFLMKIVNDKATASDRAEYRAYRRIIDRQLERIYSYLKTAQKVRGRDPRY